MPNRPTRLTLPRAALLLALLPILVGVGAPLAQGEPNDDREDLALIRGAQHFDEAIKYVSRETDAIPKVYDFEAWIDVQMDANGTHTEGKMRIAFKAPNKYRVAMTSNDATSTKILNGEQGWIQTPDRKVQTLALTAEGQGVIRQLRKDRSRMHDLTRFIALQTLKGKDVTFRFEGRKNRTGILQGKWLEIRRKARGRKDIKFWIAYQESGARQVKATWPGAVLVPGDPDEVFLLKEWDSAKSVRLDTLRYPRVIEAYTMSVGTDGVITPIRFLHGVIEELRVNKGLSPTLFDRPDGRR